MTCWFMSQQGCVTVVWVLEQWCHSTLVSSPIVSSPNNSPMSAMSSLIASAHHVKQRCVDVGLMPATGL